MYNKPSMREDSMISMVNVRGRVIWVHRWEVDIERQRGSKVISDPRQDYYPQYDQELNKGRENDTSEVSDKDLLEGEEL